MVDHFSRNSDPWSHHMALKAPCAAYRSEMGLVADVSLAAAFYVCDENLLRSMEPEAARIDVPLTETSNRRCRRLFEEVWIVRVPYRRQVPGNTRHSVRVHW